MVTVAIVYHISRLLLLQDKENKENHHRDASGDRLDSRTAPSSMDGGQTGAGGSDLHSHSSGDGSKGLKVSCRV